MTTKYPKGSFIVWDGVRRKVLAELDDLRFLSIAEGRVNWETEASNVLYHVAELERDGWVVEEPTPEPYRPQVNDEVEATIKGRITHIYADGSVNVDTGHHVQYMAQDHVLTFKPLSRPQEEAQTRFKEMCGEEKV